MVHYSDFAIYIFTSVQVSHIYMDTVWQIMMAIQDTKIFIYKYVKVENQSC